MTETKQRTASTPTSGNVVEGNVRIETTTYDPRKPELIEQAERAFKATFAEQKKTVTDVSLVKINHHVGTAAFYFFTAKVTG